MKKFLLGLGFLSLLLVASPAQAVRVNGYYKSNGTYVQPYERTAPDGNPYNNYSFPGNYNPNKGTITGGNPQTYLDNYYNNSSGSSYTSNYSAPSTPTCPANSYYDGISSCKCNSGYGVSGGSCVSKTTLCWKQNGYSSNYDSLSDTCKCDSGYLFNSSNQCTSADVLCQNLNGSASQYNSLTKKCECFPGYTYNGSICVYNAPAPVPTPTVTSTISTKNSHGLTFTQINAIISLLQSFGADASSIASVRAAMGQ